MFRVPLHPSDSVKQATNIPGVNKAPIPAPACERAGINSFLWKETLKRIIAFSPRHFISNTVRNFGEKRQIRLRDKFNRKNSQDIKENN